MRTINAEDIAAIALGGAIYGTGGGGDPYLGMLVARAMMRRNGPVRVVDVDSLPDDALVVPVAMVGAPTVLLEKMPNAPQLIGALRALEAYAGRAATALICAEAGGLNSTIPFCVASELGLPLVDGDLMGRAFPEIQMSTCTLHGIPATPLALADEKGNSVVIRATTNRFTERLVRSVTTDMGGSASAALYPMSGAQAKTAIVRGSLSMLLDAGRTLMEARVRNDDPIEAVRAAIGGFVLYRGKVVDVKRVTAGGFTRGHARLSGIEAHAASEELTLSFQNEFLVAERGSEVLATTPDLIMTLDLETGEPVTGELIRFGLRVAVLGAPCVPQWRTSHALEIVGPRYFGYDMAYRSIEERIASKLKLAEPVPRA